MNADGLAASSRGGMEASGSPVARSGSPSRRLDAALLLLVLIWGVNFPIIKGAFPGLPPLVFNGLRFVIAALVLWGSLRVLEGPRQIDRRDLPALLGLGLLGHAGYQTFFMTGLARTTAGNSSLILAMVPLFVGVLGVMLRLERPSLRMWLGLVAAFLGLFLLVEGRGGLRLDLSTALGDALVLAAAVCWAAYTVASRPYLTRMSPLRLTTVTLALGMPVIIATAVPGALRLQWVAVKPGAWAAMAFSAIFAIGVCYVIWYTSVQAVGSARTAAFSNLIPVVALIASLVLLGEPLGLLQVVGGTVVLFGVWLARTGRVQVAGAPVPAAEPGGR
ncbi:MAG: DMT family transporter [Armatimonadetes bacterium]|nr:DMT family transporter [Armatimonadota bacterium]